MRKTVTEIGQDGITLTFSKENGELRLIISHVDEDQIPMSSTVALPLWAIIEIRDYCAQHLPILDPRI